MTSTLLERPTKDVPVEQPLWSVAVSKPCSWCGQRIGYLSVGHVPVAFKTYEEASRTFGYMGVVMEAPPEAELWSVLRGRPKCTGA